MFSNEFISLIDEKFINEHSNNNSWCELEEVSRNIDLFFLK